MQVCNSLTISNLHFLFGLDFVGSLSNESIKKYLNIDFTLDSFEERGYRIMSVFFTKYRYI